MDYGASTLEVLPEIVDAVQGRIPVLIDSGFGRGTDLLEALAMTHKGRPNLASIESQFGKDELPMGSEETRRNALLVYAVGASQTEPHLQRDNRESPSSPISEPLQVVVSGKGSLK